jgi:hypothetical protein
MRWEHHADRMYKDRWAKIAWNYKFIQTYKKDIKDYPIQKQSRLYDIGDKNIKLSLKWTHMTRGKE